MNINLICIAYRRRKMGFRGYSPLKKKKKQRTNPMRWNEDIAYCKDFISSINNELNMG